MPYRAIPVFHTATTLLDSTTVICPISVGTVLTLHQKVDCITSRLRFCMMACFQGFCSFCTKTLLVCFGCSRWLGCDVIT